ncbi:unnamed protein product [Paramecium primaurelia]|uniref:Tetratricopeptide repeat protein n=1 Tax=Paramecium primaurelia TaxID=5886 RepID=A0A8S1KVI4_PARPR|nr:unnamed protein product [Paramecium primaurelia]
MKQQNLFTCQDIAHEGEVIQGFCLNLGCQDSRSQFCLQCGFDPKKHTNCKKDLKGFGQIESFLTKFNQHILDLTIQLNKSYSSVKTKYEEFTKQLHNLKISLLNISEGLSQQDYKQIKDNLQIIKEWYQYSNNQEEIMKQNQIGTQLFSIKSMIQTLDLDNKQKQQIKGIYQNNDITLEQGIELLNQKKWQEAHEKINQYLKLLEKQQSLATFFQGISLIKMNQPGKGIINIKQAKKKINSNLYRDLLDYSDIELRLNPNNEYILIAKKKKYQLAIDECEKLLIEQSQYLHALYRKSLSLQNLNEHSQAIQCIDKALNYDSKYIVGYSTKGYSLDDLGKYNEAIAQYDKAIELDPNNANAYNNKAIVCYDKTIELNPNDLNAYNNKGRSLHNLQKYNEAIVQYDKAIKLDPNDANAYDNKGHSLLNLQKYNEAIVCYDKAIELQPNNAIAYNNKGQQFVYCNRSFITQFPKYNEAIVCFDKAIELDSNCAIAYDNKGSLLSDMKKYQQAIENYEQALLDCKQDQNKFKKLIIELRNKQ